MAKKDSTCIYARIQYKSKQIPTQIPECLPSNVVVGAIAQFCRTLVEFWAEFIRRLFGGLGSKRKQVMG